MCSSQTIQELIDEANVKKEYRPVASVVLIRNDGKVLLVSSAHNRTAWGLPQGGIDDGENPRMTVTREVKEELGIIATMLTMKQSLGWCDLDAEGERSDRRGFTRGKRYFFQKALYCGPAELSINTSEIADYAWVNPKEADLLMVSTRPEKKKLTMRAIGMAVDMQPEAP